MTEFISKNYKNENFEVIIKTDNRNHYKKAEEFARDLINHGKNVSKCAECEHLQVCGRFQATGGSVRECEHFLQRGTGIDTTEMDYCNGKAAMRQALIEKLTGCKEKVRGANRAMLGEVIRLVENLEVN